MRTPEKDRARAEVYVLCKRYGRAALFACGAAPNTAAFLKDGGRARRFPSAASALAYRAGLTYQDVRECGVFRLMPDGGLIPPEGEGPSSLWARNGGARYPSAAGSQRPR
jgi:hypothetical protein